MLIKYPAKFARKYYKKHVRSRFVPYTGYVQYWNEAANELVRQELQAPKPSMICKFGTTEFSCVRNYLSMHEPRRLSDLLRYIKREKKFLWWWDTVDAMANLSGLFPATEAMADQFCKLMLQDIKEIDILGSYIKDEQQLYRELSHVKRVNLEGYYAPFRFANPWTEMLEGKKVLVVHPFEESIHNQYQRRQLLFENPKVLPQFELKTVKAVQTIANNRAGFNDWFEALDFMKDRIDQTDYDIAIIGCGAYGMPLAAHVKRMGKKAVHMAGWTQMLFGIYGRRWEKDTEMSKFINEYWVRPLPSEVPGNHTKVEQGCYW